jgi:hypothetical protein
MNNRIAKRIRKIINPSDPISRRVYRRAKEQYKKVPSPMKNKFLISLDKTINGG